MSLLSSEGTALAHVQLSRAEKQTQELESLTQTAKYLSHQILASLQGLGSFKDQ